ncbi:MAG: 16S rRNA (cytidine(1402)-2'-O)-methyltransferase [Chloroflexi bacterium]|nr:16S rRNA (cytidine(1402)-2'-O)-methyltransferase [Chloroflexota bacterium]
MGTLFVVATPIGNLEDITLRALRVLREADLIVAEDTRTTAKLLARYDIHTPMLSFFEHNELRRLDEIIHALADKNLALVSEAGMPGISDPGYRLIRAALDSGFPVVPVPGPSALITALAVSGLPADRFIYLGFLPRKRVDRQRLLASVRYEPYTLVAFEAPHRLLDSLTDVLTVLGDRTMAVGRELTKIHEEVRRGPVSSHIAHFQNEAPRGEFTFVIAGAPEGEKWTEEGVRQAIAGLLIHGESALTVAKEVASLSGWPRQRIYRMALEMGLIEKHGRGRE